MDTDEMPNDPFIVVRERDSNALVFDDEAVHMYFQCAKMNFAVGILPPGKKTPVDPGEPGIYIAYVLEGEAIFIATDGSGATEWLYEGDAILIREELPHIVYNPTVRLSRIAWALTPGHGR